MTHEHRWRRVHEESLLGGSFPIGWECADCRRFVSNDKLSPEGLGGSVIQGEHILVGAHGGTGRCSDGTPYERQIKHADGRLEIIRP